MAESQPDQPAPPPGPISGRKRVSARVLGPDEAPAPDEVRPIDPESDFAADPTQARLMGEPPPVIDPTLLGGRQRRSSHHWLYRWTQIFTLSAVAVAVVSMLLTLSDETGWARILGGIAIVLGVVGVRLSAGSHLSRRWRGWAFAAVAFAICILALSFVHASLVGDDASMPRPAKKQSGQ